MADYVQQTDFSAKDALASGDPNKLIRGSDVDGEFEAIETAIASKEDAANKGVANGYASLDASTLVPTAQLPDIPLAKLPIYGVRINSAGAAVRLPTGWTFERSSAGVYNVVHNLGSDDVVALVSIGPGSGFSGYNVRTSGRTSNQITVAVVNTSDVAADGPVEIIILE